MGAANSRDAASRTEIEFLLLALPSREGKLGKAISWGAVERAAGFPPPAQHQTGALASWVGAGGPDYIIDNSWLFPLRIAVRVNRLKREKPR